jgi:hypothetical protein
LYFHNPGIRASGGQLLEVRGIRLEADDPDVLILGFLHELPRGIAVEGAAVNKDLLLGEAENVHGEVLLVRDRWSVLSEITLSKSNDGCKGIAGLLVSKQLGHRCKATMILSEEQPGFLRFLSMDQRQHQAIEMVTKKKKVYLGSQV